MERLILRQNYKEYITRTRHGHHLPKGALCGVYRTPAGHIRVNVAAKYCINRVSGEPDVIVQFTFEGAWYFKGYENKERLDEIYRQRKSRYFRGCRAF